MKTQRKTTAAVMMTAILLSPVAATAQEVTYNHEESVMNQCTIQETGSGSFTPDFYYDALHKDYRNWASTENKLAIRTMTAAYMKVQEPYAEAIEEDLKERAKTEALNLTDREADAAWLLESGKVTEALNTFKTDIEKITLCGGSTETYEKYVEQYNMLMSGVNYLRSSYCPNAQRQEQYIAIYQDAKKRDRKLRSLLASFKRRLGIEWTEGDVSRKSGVVRENSERGIARWKIAATGASSK